MSYLFHESSEKLLLGYYSSLYVRIFFLAGFVLKFLRLNNVKKKQTKKPKPSWFWWVFLNLIHETNVNMFADLFFFYYLGEADSLFQRQGVASLFLNI